MTSAIDDYVIELTTATTGRLSRRTPRLLLEVRDHLEDAAAEGENRGLSRDRAERESIQAFGAVEDIAPAYRAALGFAELRATAIALIAVILVQPLAWGWWEGRNADTTASGPTTVLNSIPELVGLAYLVLCPATLAAGTFLLRRHDTAARLGLALGGLSSVCALSVMILALVLNALDPTMAGMLFTTTVVLIPMSAVLAYTTRGLRIVTR